MQVVPRLRGESKAASRETKWEMLQLSRQGMVLAWARVVIVELSQILGVIGSRASRIC